jgi:RNA polymerase sigma-70 factor, ECF subfamily
MDELELLKRIKNNPAKFAELFKQYYKPIFGYIFRRTGNFDETADIASDTFLKAFKHIKNFSYRGISIKVWLYRIATNELNLYFRSKKRSGSLFEKLHIDEQSTLTDYLHSDREELELELQKHEQFLAVLESLKKIPIKYQTVISLRYFEGKDNKEIMEILSIKEGTLKSLLSRGIKKLREKCNQIK